MASTGEFNTQTKQDQTHRSSSLNHWDYLNAYRSQKWEVENSCQSLFGS